MKFRVTNPTQAPVNLSVIVDNSLQSCLIYPGTHIVSASSIPQQSVVRVEPIGQVASAPAPSAPKTFMTPAPSFSKKKD